MKEIQLNTRKKSSANLFAKVDNDMYEFLSQWNWFAMKSGKKYYAARWNKIDGKQVVVLMHRVVLSTKEGLVTDHKDQDGLNNQKENLREATISQNAANIQSQKNSTSKYLGVYWITSRRKWFATICKDKKRIFLGRFKEEVEAAKAYNEAAKVYHGEFANLNSV